MPDLDLNAPFSMDVELSGSTRVIGKIEWLSDSYKRISTIEPYVGKKAPGVPGPVSVVSFFSPHGYKAGDRVYIHETGQQADGYYEVIDFPAKEHTDLNFLIRLKAPETGLSGGQVRVHQLWDVLNPKHIDPSASAELSSLRVVLLNVLSRVGGLRYRRAVLPILQEYALIGGDAEFVQDLDNLCNKHDIDLMADLPSEKDGDDGDIDDDLLAQVEMATFRKNARTVEILCGMRKGAVLDSRYYPQITEWAQGAAIHIGKLMEAVKPAAVVEAEEKKAKTEGKTAAASAKPPKKGQKPQSTNTPATSSQSAPSSPA